MIPPGYEVTRDGRVLSIKRGRTVELKQQRNGSANGRGYPSVRLYRNGKRWHVAVYRLVAAAFLPARPSKQHYICHRDGNESNSHADNLYWGTPTENNFDSWRERRRRQNLGLPFTDEETSDGVSRD